MIKQCGTCHFWDRENAMNSPHFINRKLAQCKFPVPISVPKTCTYNDQGQSCPVYRWREVKETDIPLTNEEPKLSLSVDECKRVIKCEAPDVVIRILEFIQENS